MTAVIEQASHYADYTQSWAQPGFDNQPVPGTGGFTATYGHGTQLVYDKELAKRAACRIKRAHTGGTFELQGVVVWVYVDAIRPVHEDAECLTLADTLRAIRAAFGLSTTQLAEVMKVERVTIYAWMSSNSRDSIRETSRDRLNLLQKIAAAWSAKAPLYGKYLHEVFTETGKTVYDLLTEDTLNPVAFDYAHDKLTTIASSENRKLAQEKNQRAKNKAMGLTLHKAFKTLGS